MNERDFDQLVASVKQAGAIKRGKLKPGLRIQMDPTDIKMIRKKLNKAYTKIMLIVTMRKMISPKLNECFVVGTFFLPSDQQSAEPIMPSMGSFDDPSRAGCFFWMGLGAFSAWLLARCSSLVPRMTSA